MRGADLSWLVANDNRFGIEERLDLEQRARALGDVQRSRFSQHQSTRQIVSSVIEETRASTIRAAEQRRCSPFSSLLFDVLELLNETLQRHAECLRNDVDDRVVRIRRIKHRIQLLHPHFEDVKIGRWWRDRSVCKRNVEDLSSSRQNHQHWFSKLLMAQTSQLSAETHLVSHLLPILHRMRPNNRYR